MLSSPEHEIVLSRVTQLNDKIREARTNFPEESLEVQIPYISRRLEKALLQALQTDTRSREFWIPQDTGYRVVQAQFVKEISFGYAGRRSILAIYRDNQWEVEYWYSSFEHPQARTQAPTAEQALLQMLPAFHTTNAWGSQSENR